MGIVGLTGRNTASFDPKSTLVRPAMRVYYGPPQKKYKKEVNLDDVIIVPEFLCREDSFDAYNCIQKELCRLHNEPTLDMGALEFVQQVVSKVCRYFKIDEESRALCISWYQHGADENPQVFRNGKFKDVPAKQQNCLVSLALGAPRELAFRRSKTDELLFFPQFNGALTFFGRDVCSRWQHGMNICTQASAARGHVSIAIMGNSSIAAAETVLPLGPSDEKRGADAFRHAKTGELLYFPQKNGMLFYFGRDANIVWQHGINALPDCQQDGKGRVSIILWGLCTTTVEEANSPPMLTDESRDGKGKGKGKPNYDGRRNQPCRDHQRGSCSYGDRCRFSHSL